MWVMRCALYMCVLKLGKVEVLLLKEGGPFSRPESELSKETHVLTKQEILLGKGTQAESGRVRESRRTALPHGPQSRDLW